jgi:quinoprotein glucose dehydrogenase
MMPRPLGLLFSLLIVLAVGATAHAQVTETQLPIEPYKAFPKLKFNRPIIVDHAGDGSGRLFVASQLGVVHVFPKDAGAETTQIFMDISDRVVYKDRENEEGFLGMTFHPKYTENGEFFVYYTTTEAPHTSVISRFRVSKDNPDQADPTFEEELMRIDQPFWNHNGGTIVFGPDGYLYVGLGDGGKANDPMGNGQNLKTLLGSILRIDVDNKDPGKNYAVPKDNPFVEQPEGARGEIWAYGLRNVWRMSFDRANGTFWAADVGQDIWEEIDIIVRGGNYGWNLREGMHKFGPSGAEASAELIDPIWEYHHDIGKSITGGFVYRGKALPELVGCYLYADYITGRLWALNYDYEAGKVVANYALDSSDNLPVMSIGEDQDGEPYYTVTFGDIYGLRRAGTDSP